MWPETETTQELLSEARKGDAQAIDRLFERHRDALRRLVQMRLDRKIQRRLDVSDVVQDVLVDASRRLKKYLDDPAMPFHLWLRHIAKDRIIDAHRRHRVSAKRSIDREQYAAPPSPDQSTRQLVAELCDRELTPAAAASMRELVQSFEQAIEQLEEQDREIVVMRHYEQLTNLEVAQALSLSEPAASMRHLRAMRRLKALLGPASGDAKANNNQ